MRNNLTSVIVKYKLKDDFENTKISKYKFMNLAKGRLLIEWLGF